MKRAIILLLLLLLAPAPLLAQPAMEGRNLQIVPKIGVFTPLGRLTEQVELTPGLAYGVAAELALPRNWFTVRVNLDQAHRIEAQEPGSDEPTGEVSITNLGLDLVLRPLGWSALARPYFLAGPALKVYSPDEAGWPGLPQRTNRLALHVGGGFDVRVGPVWLVLEIADYVSTFPAPTGTESSRVQNHLYGLVGFRVGLF